MDRIAATRKSMAVYACSLIGSVCVIVLVPVCFLVERIIFDGSSEEFANAPLWWSPIIGLLGTGLIPAVWALLAWGRVRVRYGNQWNPASAYLSWGTRLAVLTLFVGALIVSAIILVVGLDNPTWKEFLNLS